MTGKQQTLASMFGGRGVAASAGAGNADKKREREAPGAEEPAAKLQKAGEGASPGTGAASPQEDTAPKVGAVDLEDSDDEGGAQAQPTAAKPNAFSAMMGAAEQATPEKAPKAAVLASEDEDETGAASESEDEASASDGEGFVVPDGTPKKKTKKATKKRAGSTTPKKVAGKAGGAELLAAEYASARVEDDVTWKAGKPVPYEVLADCLEEIANESKRLLITGMLTRRFRAILRHNPDELLPTVYLCVNRVAAAHEGVELGIGDATLIKALSIATGRSEAKIKEDYKDAGDLGTIAVNAKAAQKVMFKPARLTVKAVFAAFREIAKIEGTGSQNRKQGAITKLLAASDGNEAGYIMRSLQGKLRIGLAEQTVLVSLAHAAMLHHMELAGEAISASALPERMAEAEDAVKLVFSNCPSYDLMLPPLIAHGVKGLEDRCGFRPGLPVKPMLAKATNAVQEVLDKFEGRQFTCEYKYDGERAQVHVMDGGKTVRIFSRNSEDMTGKYPDIVARIPKCLAEGTESVVLDCEAVGWDPVKQQILPFQDLSKRARKDVTVDNVKVQVVLYAFDCLYYNGKPLLQRPLTERREALYSSIKEIEHEVQFAVAKESTDVEELTRFLDESIKDSTEGLIVKTMDDTYEPSKRSLNWLKLKKDYLSSGGDTIDAVPIGAWYGKGKRVGVYGSFLLAVYNPEDEEFQTLCKIGTGFSEEQLETFSKQLEDSQVDKAKGYFRYSEDLIPDAWFEPKYVWEIKVADLSISPRHMAAIGMADEGRGISVRFPRLERVRDDKTPEMATTSEQIYDMYKSQSVIANNA